MLGKICEVVRDESGATTIEYGLIVAMVSVGIMAALSAFGDSLQANFTTMSEAVDDSVAGN